MFSTMVIHANSITRIQYNAWMILLPFNISMLLNLPNPLQSSRFIGRGVVKFYRYSFSPSPTLIHDSLPNRLSAELLVYSELESGSWKRDIEVDFIVLIYYYRVIGTRCSKPRPLTRLNVLQRLSNIRRQVNEWVNTGSGWKNRSGSLSTLWEFQYSCAVAAAVRGKRRKVIIIIIKAGVRGRGKKERSE